MLELTLLCIATGFGDWHPDVFVDGLDTYDWEMRALAELQRTEQVEATTHRGGMQ
jgi:hypothetical protein